MTESAEQPKREGVINFTNERRDAAKANLEAKRRNAPPTLKNQPLLEQNEADAMVKTKESIEQASPDESKVVYLPQAIQTNGYDVDDNPEPAWVAKAWPWVQWLYRRFTLRDDPMQDDDDEEEK